MNNKRYLIIPQNWLGDIIMTQCLIKKIHKEEPLSKIDLLVSKNFSPIVKRMPEVNNVIESCSKHKRFPLINIIKKGLNLQSRYDESIILSRSFKSSLIPFISKIPIRTGELGELRFFLINNIVSFKKEERRISALRYSSMFKNKDPGIQEQLYPQLNKNESNLQSIIAKHKININNKIISIAPGAAFGISKMWPVKKFIKLADKIETMDNTQFLILGSSKEKMIGEQISKNRKNFINLCGQTSLDDLVDILHLSTYCISNDSGIMHVAAATKTKVIALFGSTSPLFTPPLSTNSQVIYKDIKCSPCFQKTCKYNHYDCMNNIHEDEVITYLK